MDKAFLASSLMYFICEILVVPIGYYFVCWLVNIKSSKKKMLLFTIPTSLIFGVLTAYISVYMGGSSNLTMIILSYLSLLAHVVGIYLLFKADLKKLFIASAIVTVIAEGVGGISLILNDLLGATLRAMGVGGALLLLSLTVIILSPLLLLLVFLIFKKIKFKSILGFYFLEKRTTNFLLVFSLLLPALAYKYNLLSSWVNQYLQNSVPLISVLLLFLQLGIIYYLGSNARSKEKIKYWQAALSQQEIYIQELEKMQQEMRIFRHNYKNMLSGMYIQAAEGELKAVTDYIQKATLDFDVKIGDNIKQSMQLGNVQIVELKSLLLTKLLLMNQKAIKSNFEAISPIDKVHMAQDDFLVCLGILIDNAIEATEKMADPEVHILLTRQEKSLTVVISNKVDEPVDCHRIWECGHSTKGDYRGIGLFSYKKIIDKYPNIISLTNCANNSFTQELRIMDV